MNRYPISIELLSETIFGNGESKNGIVNTEVLIDENGFPYLNGKTFKGYLKDAINNILKPYYENKDKKDFEKLMEKFFGNYINADKEENSLNYLQVESEVRITNFYIEGDIVSIFSEDIEDRKQVIFDSLTDTRFSIMVDNKEEEGNGVSKEKSLRASRVLRKGLVFKGYLEMDKPLNEAEEKFITRGIKALKNMGVHKSRGKGLVKVDLGNLQKDDHEKSKGIKEKFQYIFYELNLVEPIKIGDSQSQYDYEESKSYISGSTIRGALLNKYLKLNNIGAQSANNSEKFNELLKRVYFYDVYPIFNEKNNKYYSFPTPNIFRITKDRNKDENKVYSKKEYSLVLELGKVKHERRVIKLKKGDFSYYRNNTLYQFNIDKDYKFHHTSKQDEENIFRYESISKGQKFYGIINVSKIDDDLKNGLYNLINEKEILYLGGSRTAGYGKTEVNSIETIKDFTSLKEKLGYLKSSKGIENMDIYFLSDAVLRDDTQQIKPYFSREYIRKNLGVEVKKEVAEINPVILTGYNSKWRTTLPHVYGIEKGSVIRLEKSNNCCESKKYDFISKQHGDRKLEGLGRVIINPEFLNAKEIQYVSNDADTWNYCSNKSKLPEELLSKIRIDRDEAIVNVAIKEYVYKNKQNLDSSNSKINNFISIIDKCLLIENSFNEFRKEIDTLSNITQNEERNRENSKLLNTKILKTYSIKSLVTLNIVDIKSLVNEILEKNKNPFPPEYILLKVIRDSLYYSLKASKRGENNE